LTLYIFISILMLGFFEKKWIVSRRHVKRGERMKTFFDDSTVEDYFLQLLPEREEEEFALRKIGEWFPKKGLIYGMYGKAGLTIIVKKTDPMTCGSLRRYLKDKEGKDRISHFISKQIAEHIVNCGDCREIALKSLELELPVDSSPTGAAINAIIRRQTGDV